MQIKVALLEASYGKILQKLDALSVNGSIIDEVRNLGEAVGFLGQLSQDIGEELDN